MEKELEQLIQDVNKRIENGENKNIKIKKSGDEITFTLPYPDEERPGLVSQSSANDDHVS